MKISRKSWGVEVRDRSRLVGVVFQREDKAYVCLRLVPDEYMNYHSAFDSEEDAINWVTERRDDLHRV